jgi:hypothetical protein
MLRRSGYIIVASSTALALLYCLLAVEVTPATARAPQQVEPANVNRVLKGDRLPVTASRATPIKVQASEKLPAGCEAIVSAIIRSPLAQIAGRCVS